MCHNTDSRSPAPDTHLRQKTHLITLLHLFPKLIKNLLRQQLLCSDCELFSKSKNREIRANFNWKKKTEALLSCSHTDQRADNTTLISTGTIYIQNTRAVCLQKLSPCELCQPLSPLTQGTKCTPLKRGSSLSNACPLEGSHRLQ